MSFTKIQTFEDAQQLYKHRETIHSQKVGMWPKRPSVARILAASTTPTMKKQHPSKRQFKIPNCDTERPSESESMRKADLQFAWQTSTANYFQKTAKDSQQYRHQSFMAPFGMRKPDDRFNMTQMDDANKVHGFGVANLDSTFQNTTSIGGVQQQFWDVNCEETHDDKPQISIIEPSTKNQSTNVTVNHSNLVNQQNMPEESKNIQQDKSMLQNKTMLPNITKTKKQNVHRWQQKKHSL